MPFIQGSMAGGSDSVSWRRDSTSHTAPSNAISQVSWILHLFFVLKEASAPLRACSNHHSVVICSGRRSEEGLVVILVTQPASISTAILLIGSPKPRPPGNLTPVPGHSLQPGGHQTATPTPSLKEGSTQALVEPDHSKTSLAQGSKEQSVATLKTTHRLTGASVQQSVGKVKATVFPTEGSTHHSMAVTICPTASNTSQPIHNFRSMQCRTEGSN